MSFIHNFKRFVSKMNDLLKPELVSESHRNAVKRFSILELCYEYAMNMEG